MQLDGVDEDIISENEDSENESEEEETEEASEGKRQPYNDQAGLKSKLNQIKLNLDWKECLTITINTDEINLPGTKKDDTIDKKDNKDFQDDFQREMFFYCQAQTAAKEALSKLRDLGIPTERPEDYFAEMVKTDAHMQKIRKKLLEKRDKIEQSDKAKKQRHYKKIGKQIQHDILQKRQQEKKKMLQEVDRMKKGKVDKLYGDDGDDPFDVSTDTKTQTGKKRKRKDDKFGFGGRKRKLKKNSAESAADMTSFKSDIHGKARNKNKRMGNMGRKNKGKIMNKNKKKGKR